MVCSWRRRVTSATKSNALRHAMPFWDEVMDDVSGEYPEIQRESVLIDALAAHYLERDIDLVLGIEARGFIFGPALAYRLNAGFVPVRKPRKLPAPTAKVTYDLEYGTDSLEIHQDAIEPGQNVIIVDDLLATGGTMEATVKLVRQLGGRIAGLGFAIELDFLKGRERFEDCDVFSLLHYNE